MADPSAFALTNEDMGDDVRVLAVRGDADRFRVDAVNRAIQEARDDGRDVIVDLSETSYLDSSMLAALVGASEEGRRRAEALVILLETPRLRRAFEMKGLQSVLSVANSRDQALELLAGRDEHADEPTPEQG